MLTHTLIHTRMSAQQPYIANGYCLQVVTSVCCDVVRFSSCEEYCGWGHRGCGPGGRCDSISDSAGGIFV